jgi:hypothetical protein
MPPGFAKLNLAFDGPPERSEASARIALARILLERRRRLMKGVEKMTRRSRTICHYYVR